MPAMPRNGHLSSAALDGAQRRRRLMISIDRFILAGIVGALIVGVAPAAAQALPKEGRLDYVACWSGSANTMGFSKTLNALTYEHTGVTRSNLPNSPFDKLAFRCIGMGTNFDGKAGNATVCEAVDKDGDKMLNHFVLSEGRVARTTVAGTGKFEGIVIDATVTTLGPFPAAKPGTFQNCNHQVGTYRFK
jgi:hypothetical protein